MRNIIIFDLDDTIFPRLNDNYTEKDLSKIKPYFGVINVLENKDYIKILVTKGDRDFQLKKIENLNIKKYFDNIYITSNIIGKLEFFKKIKEDYLNSNFFVIGDRIDLEIKYGNMLGFKTILLKKGKYKNKKPKDLLEIPMIVINEMKELRGILKCKQ